MANTKICSKCKKELSYSEYHKENRAKDGLRNMCKSCMNQYDKMHSDKNYSHLYYIKNREKIIL